MRIAVLAKQVPRFEELSLGPDGRLRRDDLELEINPYCRRAIAKGVELARETGGTCTVLTLGPPSAAEVLREAIAWGADEGVLLSDPAFAGSDTLATAKAIAAALRRRSYDLVLAGLNSVDSDTGQVGPQLAELLDLPFLGGVRELTVKNGHVRARCERDDGHAYVETTLPAVLTAAERLCAPAKVPPLDRRAEPGQIRTLTAADLGPGPWGAAASPTSVGEVRTMESGRARRRLTGTLDEQVREAVRMMADSGALTGALTGAIPAGGSVPRTDPGGPVAAVVTEDPGSMVTRELLGAAARLAAEVGGGTALLTPAPKQEAWSWGADEIVVFGDGGPEGAAAAVVEWARTAGPWAILLPGTAWGREVASRASVRLEAGLTGDAVGLEATGTRLLGWKSAFGGQAVVAVTASSPVHLATVRCGVLPAPPPRTGGVAKVRELEAVRADRVTVTGSVSDDEPGRLRLAPNVVGVGRGVDPARYGELEPLLGVLGAELAATRKVTDEGWLPRSRQLGITGRAVAPGVYVALGTSGKFNHMVGVRGARFVLAVNTDPDAPLFECADAGIVAGWEPVVPLLVAELTHMIGRPVPASPQGRR